MLTVSAQAQLTYNTLIEVTEATETRRSYRDNETPRHETGRQRVPKTDVFRSETRQECYMTVWWLSQQGSRRTRWPEVTQI